MELTRRGFLAAVGAGAGLAMLGACARPARELALTAAPVELDLGGQAVETWGYNGTVPGPEIRLRAGELLRVPLRNRLPEDTTIHWHGLALDNTMDGVAGLTQPPVVPGAGFDYAFRAPEAGSFMYHAHVGHQLDRGLYGALIVEPAREELAYDREYTVMLDDWRDGLDGSAHRDHGEPAGDSRISFGGRRYPLTLVNGHPPTDPAVFEVSRGDRVRLRVMNIGADTGFRFAVAGHRLTVTHTDGMPVEPITVDALRLGMGERYDVLVHADNPGAWQIGVLAEGRAGFGRAVLRYAGTAGTSAPPTGARPDELDGRLPGYGELRSVQPTEFNGRPDRAYPLALSGTKIDGQHYDDADPLPVVEGEWVRFTFRNTGAKWHPMHLHGHHFRVLTPDGRGPRKDTVSVPAHGGEVSIDVRADNPGRWLLHCHNHHHMEDGMARRIDYR